jgi:hypothetical protein
MGHGSTNPMDGMKIRQHVVIQRSYVAVYDSGSGYRSSRWTVHTGIEVLSV